MNIDEDNERKERIFMNMNDTHKNDIIDRNNINNINDRNDRNDRNIFEKLINKESNKSIDTDTDTDIFIFIFKTHFTPNNLKNQYSWKKYIKYKYYILKNFLLANDDIYSSKTKTLDFFSQIQRKMMALYKFKQICLFKTTKYLNEQMDLNFTPLDEVSSNKISFLHINKKVQFSIFDLIRIINTALSNESYFFLEPQTIKNPWNNQPFSISNLYNIFFYIKQSTIYMPILFSRFFESNFNINHFEQHNQFIIKNFILNNSHMLNNDSKLSYIHALIDYYNTHKKSQIIVDTDFPSNRLIEVMSKFIKNYLLAIYSHEADLRTKNKIILLKKIQEFKNNNPLFGRKIISRHIRQLYYISRLINEEKQIFFIPPDVYIPPPQLISLKHKSFYIDYKEMGNTYSIFPLFDNHNYKLKPKLKQNQNQLSTSTNILHLLKDYKFTNHQLQIIKEKYYPIVQEQFPFHTNISTPSPDTTNCIENSSIERDIVDNRDDRVDDNRDDRVDDNRDDRVDDNRDDRVDENRDDRVDENRDDRVDDNFIVYGVGINSDTNHEEIYNSDDYIMESDSMVDFDSDSDSDFMVDFDSEFESDSDSDSD